jgi:hypothetical protein
MRRLLLAALLALPVLAIAGGASADCSLPTVGAAPDAGTPGSPITVTGHAWGTNCYDTGPPPPGEGPLGIPQTDIDVVFRDAAGTETVLATVDADTEYGFTLEAAVPAGAAAGPGRVAARGSTGFVAVGEAFTVTGGVIPATPVFTG